MTTSKTIIWMAILAVIFGVVGTIFYYQTYIVVETHEIPLYVEVVDSGTAGINVETDSLNFGKIPFGGGGRKQFTVTNTHDFPVLVQFTHNGDTSGAIQFDPFQPVIEPHTNQTIRTILDTSTLSAGEHTDMIIVTLTRT